jgi:hypothetical protein
MNDLQLAAFVFGVAFIGFSFGAAVAEITIFDAIVRCRGFKLGGSRYRVVKDEE